MLSEPKKKISGHKIHSQLKWWLGQLFIGCLFIEVHTQYQAGFSKLDIKYWATPGMGFALKSWEGRRTYIWNQNSSWNSGSVEGSTFQGGSLFGPGWWAISQRRRYSCLTLKMGKRNGVAEEEWGRKNGKITGKADSGYIVWLLFSKFSFSLSTSKEPIWSPPGGLRFLPFFFAQIYLHCIIHHFIW